MAIFGWQTLKEAERYTKAARRKKMAGDAMPLLEEDQRLNESFPLLGGFTFPPDITNWYSLIFLKGGAP